MQPFRSLQMRQGILCWSIIEPSYQYNSTIRAHFELVRLQSAPSLSGQSVHVCELNSLCHTSHQSFMRHTVGIMQLSLCINKNALLYFTKGPLFLNINCLFFVSYLSSKYHWDQLQTYQGAWTVESLELCPKTPGDSTKPHFEISVSNVIINEVVISFHIKQQRLVIDPHKLLQTLSCHIHKMKFSTHQ